jgi:medium-chain acyl-[acyl-carrier-protein] hydrolase
VQLPGREYRILEEPFSDITPLIPLLARALHPYLDMPYALFGHSMGALVSFELARYLNQSEHAPDPMHLFVSGRRAPHLTASEPPIGQLPELAFIEELRRLNGTPEEVLQNDELLHLLMPLLRADFTLCEKYIYREESILKCPLSAFAGLQDEEVSSNELIAWREQTSGPFKYRFFIGNHFFLHEEQTSLLQAITRDLFSVLSW